MIKYFGIIRDIVLVYDDYRANGLRYSEIQLTAIAGILVSLAVAVGWVPIGVEDALTQAIFGLLSAGWNVIFMFLRERSKGGQIKLRVDRDAANRDADSPPDDEHGMV